MNQIDGQQVHVEVPKTFASVGASVGVAPTVVRKIPLYACGGCGINVGAMIANMHPELRQHPSSRSEGQHVRDASS